MKRLMVMAIQVEAQGVMIARRAMTKVEMMDYHPRQKK
jgi:hypothetical protein